MSSVTAALLASTTIPSASLSTTVCTPNIATGVSTTVCTPNIATSVATRITSTRATRGSGCGVPMLSLIHI